MKQDKTNARGGARTGAGRPRLTAEAARGTITCRVMPQNAQLLARMKEAGIHLGMAMDGIIPELAARYGIQ